MRQTVIGVIGAGDPNPVFDDLAYAVGAALSQQGAALVCGGRGGVMEAASRGAAEAGGRVIGILPGNHRAEGNPWLSVAVATGLGEARNLAVVRSSDAVIAIGGSYGTLSEIAFCLKFGVPLVGLKTWRLQHDAANVEDPIVRAATPKEAVEAAMQLAVGGGGPS